MSAAQKVTSITFAYSLNGCSDSVTLTGLSLEIATVPVTRPPGNPGSGAFDNPQFAYASGATNEPNFVSISGAFTSSDTAVGVTAFSNFRGCGNGVAAWNATRR